MLNEAFGSVIDHSWIPLSAWRRLHFLEPKRLAQNKLDFLDNVPVMSATVLALDMLLHEPCIDLQRAAELILSDVGATIQILLLIGREYDFTAERLSRMGDSGRRYLVRCNLGRSHLSLRPATCSNHGSLEALPPRGSVRTTRRRVT